MILETRYEYKKEKLPIPILEGHEDWIALYYKAWELAFRNVKYVDKEGWKPQLTCMPGKDIIWQWDSSIMTFITNYANGTLSAFNNLDNLYRLQRETDGYISMAYQIYTEEEAYRTRINPPLLAWAEWEGYLISGDSSRFERVLPHLEGFYNFIENNRRRGSGLYWFEDTNSSGMDNSPRSGCNAALSLGSDVCYIDLACQQALSAKCIGHIYEVLGNEEKAEFYANENKRICELINRHHWSERAGFYFDVFERTWTLTQQWMHFINNKTVASFWTFICGAATRRRKDAMIEHLFNPDEFYTKIPFASLSKDHPNYHPTGAYWVGGVWAPTNFAAIRGLKETGKEELAREAAMRYLDAICQVDADPAYGSIWEAYAPEALRPSTRETGDLVRPDFVGWSGIAPITMLIENIIGLTFNARKNEVIFQLSHNYQCSGLKNMCFNGRVVSVECREFHTMPGQTLIEVETDKPFRLIVRAKHFLKEVVLEVPEGKHQYYL